MCRTFPVPVADRRGLLPVALLTLTVLAGGGMTSRSAAQQPTAAPRDDMSWLTGEPLEHQLDAPAGISLEGSPLRDSLRRLSEAQRVAVFLDRRIDPGQTIELASGQQPLREILSQVAERIGAGAVRIGPVVYLAPGPLAEAIATTAALREQQVAESLTAEVRNRWRQTHAWNWPRLSTPRGLLQELAEEGRFRLEGLERIPHDLWPAAELPPMTLSDRLSLLLAGFRLTFEVSPDGRVVSLVPLPEEPRLRASYPLPGAARGLAAKLRRQLPEARLQQSGDQLTLEGTWSQHDRLRRLLREQSGPRSSEPPRQTWQLRVKNETVGVVARKISEQLGRRLETERGIEELLRQRVSFEVEQATLDQLLHAVFDPVGLEFDLNQERLRIFRGNRGTGGRGQP